MSKKSNSVEINHIEPYKSQQNIKEKNKDLLIKNLKSEIVTLSKEILKLKTDNADLRSRVSLVLAMEQNFKSAKETINDMREQTNKIICDKDQEQRKLKMKIEQMELEKTLDQLKNNRNMTLYNQKMSVVHHIEHENKVYKDEVNDLKIKNLRLERATKEKMESLDILNQIKFSQFKKKMIDNLKEAKDNVSKLNLEYMDLNGKITILQNHQLLSEIEFQKEHIDSLDKENIRLKKRIFDLEKELAVHKKVEIKLAIKAKTNLNKTNNANNPNLNSFNKKSIFFKQGYNTNTNFNTNNQNNDNSVNPLNVKGVTLLPITNNNFKSINSKNLLNKEKINDILTNNNNNNNNTNNNNNINEYSNRGNKTVSKSSTSYNQKFRIESGNNNNNNNNVNSNIPSDRNEMTDLNFKYTKFNRIIKKKNEEIEKLKITIDNLKNKLDNYIGRNKALYLFLEESINLFFIECEQMVKERKINIDIENIKKFDFELLNNDEKYCILVLLMKYLLPLVLVNTNSKNVKENIFKTNINVNLINRNIAYNSAEKYLREPSLRNAFIGKKIKNNLFFDSKSIQYYGNGNLIPVLRKTESPNDSRIKDNRFRSVIK